MRILAAFLTLLTFVSADAFAVPIHWNTWSSAASGSLTVNADSVGVTFATTNSHAAIANYPSWTPAATFADGVIVDNAPVAANGIMQLTGGTTATNTLTFSVPVVDPVISIWSLGAGGSPASFVFVGVSPALVAGGPSAEYGGSSIIVAGNTVSGTEGNGTIQLLGTFSSIQWTNPQRESWYGFNVGVADVGIPHGVPEPQQLLLFLLGLGVLVGGRTLTRARAPRLARASLTRTPRAKGAQGDRSRR